MEEKEDLDQEIDQLKLYKYTNMTSIILRSLDMKNVIWDFNF